MVITDQLTGFTLPSDQRLPLGQLDSDQSPAMAHSQGTAHSGRDSSSIDLLSTIA